MCGHERAGLRGRGFGGVPPFEDDCSTGHTLRCALQAWHVLRGAQTAVLARAVLMPVNQDKR